MAFNIDAVSEYEGLNASALSALGESKIHLKDREDEETIRKTISTALPALNATLHPGSSDKLPIGKVSVGAPLQSAADLEIPHDLANPAGLERIRAPLDENSPLWDEVTESNKKALKDVQNELPHFPNLAWESVKAGLVKEEINNKHLGEQIKKAETCQKEIDLLLDFSAEITAFPPDKSENEMTERMKEILAELKEKGIDLWKSNDTKISKEKAIELKSLGSAQVDKLRSDLQILFTTKIQVLIQNMSSIMEALKDIVKNNTRLNSTVIGHYAGR